MSGVLQGEDAGPRDPRVRYHVLKPCPGKGVWMEIGIAYCNPDGTIDAYLDVIPICTRIRLRKIPPTE